MTKEERAKQSATSIINWCLDVDVQDAEEDPNFVTSEIMRVMKWQKDNDTDIICDLMISMLNDGMIETRDIGAVNMKIRKAMEDK